LLGKSKGCESCDVIDQMLSKLQVSHQCLFCCVYFVIERKAHSTFTHSSKSCSQTCRQGRDAH